MKNKGRCGETAVEADADARAVGSVAGREALREWAHQHGKRSGCCVPAGTEDFVCETELDVKYRADMYSCEDTIVHDNS